MLRSIAFPILSLLLLVSVVACSRPAKDVTFELEPTNKASVGSTGPLAVGSRILFKVKDFKPNETLFLYRCGDPCNTAKLIASWDSAYFGESPDASFTLEQAGVYYFWVQRRLEGGEVGPVFGESSSTEDRWLVTKFKSGTVIFVAVDPSS